MAGAKRMPRTSTKLNYSNIVECLRQEFDRQKYTILSECEEFPSLPIDLFCTKGKGKSQEWSIALVAAVKHISDEFQKKLFFLQYLLSLHYKPSQYKIILAVPHTTIIETTPFYAETEEEQQQDFYKVNGFGLWKIDDHGIIDKDTYPAISLREKINRDFYDIVVEEDSEMRNKDHLILPFVDKYIHDSVLGIAKQYQIKFEERNIDQKLLELCLNLRKVPYRKLLANLINEHLSLKNRNDFDFCTDVLNKLWYKHFNSEIYPEEHRKLETLLMELYPKYRDHYIHQLQVFLTGVLILDILIERRKIIPKNGYPCLSWLLAASFHDFAYPLQLYDDFVSRYVKECLSTVGDWRFLSLKDDYTEFSFSSEVEHIIASLANCFTGEFEGEAGVNNSNVIRQFFYREITETKNHGLVGSLGLLKRFRNNPKVDFKNVVLPAAVAISVHDLAVCQRLHGIGLDTEDEYISLAQKLAPLNKLDFETQNLAFLLILCDNIQDWGRHFKDAERETPLKEANIRLKDLIFNSGRIIIQMYFNDTRESRKFMKDKDEILSGLEKLLKVSGIEFVIEYWDREKDKKVSHYTIGNSK
jgi:hypothetical protein